ncbi:LOW QUALITY PROTEIN: gap junction gamma-3 protein [Rhynchonycteris naso]
MTITAIGKAQSSSEGDRQQSTPVGHLLLPVLLGFRLVLRGMGVYGNEQSESVCHIQQPSCKAACYDAFHALSDTALLSLLGHLGAVPSALYMSFTIYHGILHWEEPGKVKKEEETLIQQGQDSTDASAAKSPRLLWDHVAQPGVLALEGETSGEGKYHQYGFQIPIFSEQREPYPSRVIISSHPSEKTIFLKTMFGVSGLCLSFTLLEFVLLSL